MNHQRNASVLLLYYIIVYIVPCILVCIFPPSYNGPKRVTEGPEEGINSGVDKAFVGLMSFTLFIARVLLFQLIARVLFIVYLFASGHRDKSLYMLGVHILAIILRYVVQWLFPESKETADKETKKRKNAYIIIFIMVELSIVFILTR